MKQILSIALLSISSFVVAQNKPTVAAKQSLPKAPVKSVVAATKTSVTDAHKHTRAVNVEMIKTGLQVYIWHWDDNQLSKAKEGDQVALHARLFGNDGKTMINDFGFLNGVPVQRQNFGFMYEGILKMAPGDSAVFSVSTDSMFGKQMPPFAKTGEKVNYSFVMYTKEAAQKMVDEKKKMHATTDEKKLKEYFAAHNITPTKTAEGMYYVITQKGNGEIPQTGNEVVVNYSGKLLDGTAFDSNVDTAFHHVQPFKFKLNTHQVIQGWDIGFSHLSKGTKATLYVPSCLAYCDQPQPGSKIKPNDILIFEVELVDINVPLDPSKQFDKYFAENHIKAEKTPEGLYYVITQQGTGDKPKVGQSVVANYTGKLLDGKKFDSNMEEEFHHVQPFSFALGQHMVISGWDIGFALLNKGAKATLYIPSNLAYGENGQGPIPANAPLIFDVELVDIK